MQESLGPLLEKIASSFPARSKQVTELATWFTATRGVVPNLLLQGTASTGKSSVIRAVLEIIGLRYAYVLCSESTNQKQLLASILAQLAPTLAAKHVGSQAYDSIVDFFLQLEGCCPSTDQSAVIVLDDAHHLLQSPVLTGLWQVRLHSRAAVSLVLVSKRAWGGACWQDLQPLPHIVHFPAYTDSELVQVLLRHAPPDADPNMYSGFLEAVVVANFRRVTLDVRDLHAAATYLWPKYIQPLHRTGATRQMTQPELVFAAKAHIKRALDSFEAGVGCLDCLDADAEEGRKLDFELPYLSKWLLVAAYLASRNKATFDKLVFDSSARRGKCRSRNHQNHDRQVEAEKEALLKGPHPFPLQRLLLVYHALLRSELGHRPPALGGGKATPDHLEEMEEADEVGRACRIDLLDADCADILVAVTSLVSLRLLSQVGEELLEGPRYACQASDDLARLIATNLGVDILRYLRLA